MARFWPFRSVYNFGLSVLGLCGVSFYGYGIYNEQNFSNPVVAEAVKVLGKNQKVKEMIGYPLSYQSSTRNKYNENGNEMYFDFKVIGPRGSTEVEVTATKLKAKQVYEYDGEIQSIKSAQNKYLELKKEVEELESSIKSNNTTKSSGSWFGGKKSAVSKNEPSQNSQAIQLKLKECEQAKKAWEDLVNERKLRKNQYCIPQKEYYTQIVGQNGKDNDKVLPEEATLYKLENIACQLPNKSRINVLNSGQAYKSEDYQTKLDNQVNFSDYKKPLYGPLHQKLSINVAELSDQEIEQYSKHKTNFMYQRYSQYRILSFMIFIIGSGALFLYFAKNKTKSLSNSVFYQLAVNKVNRHPKIIQLIKSHHLKELDIDKSVGGGMKNNVFNCQIGVNNLTMGKIQIQGKHNVKAGTYDYSKFLFKYVQNNKHKQIDLLK